MNEKIYKKVFNRLFNLFSDTHLHFYTSKALRNEKYEELYEMDNTFWIATLGALQNSWLSSLSKLYEKGQYTKINTDPNKLVLSVYTLLEFHTDVARKEKVQKILDNNITIIENIEKIRPKLIAHNDIKAILEPNKLLKQYSLNFEKIESLLKASEKILNNLSPNQKDKFSLIHEDKQYEKDIERFLNKIKYYKDKRGQHLDDFMFGKIDDPKFPMEE